MGATISKLSIGFKLVKHDSANGPGIIKLFLFGIEIGHKCWKGKRGEFSVSEAIWAENRGVKSGAIRHNENEVFGRLEEGVREG